MLPDRQTECGKATTLAHIGWLWAKYGANLGMLHWTDSFSRFCNIKGDANHGHQLYSNCLSSRNESNIKSSRRRRAKIFKQLGRYVLKSRKKIPTKKLKNGKKKV